MALSPAEELDAQQLYILSKISPAERAHAKRIRRAEAAVAKAEQALAALKETCTHPLIARFVENRGNTGNWDREDHYWAAHRCSLCNRRWNTHQRWQHVGTRLGLPDDPEAKDT